MSCNWACQMMDDYLENRLGQYDRQRLEAHLALCRVCARELRSRPAFEHTVGRTLAESVQGLHLPSEACDRIVQLAQAGLKQAIWFRRVLLALQVVTGVVLAAIALAALLILTGRGRLPGVSLPVLLPATSSTSLSLAPNDLFIEPWHLKPGDTFTVTLLLRNNASQPLDTARIDLEVVGPTGDYRFVLAVRGPLPAHGVSILQVTPELLALPCRAQYQKSPAEILSVPGVYTFRATLFSPVSANGH